MPQFLSIFETNIECTCISCEKYLSKLHVSRLLIRTFAGGVYVERLPFQVFLTQINNGGVITSPMLIFAQTKNKLLKKWI